ncbi:hypothetical protein HG535_0A08360 [Zygotorulaspora mrakii]|uniref:SH3 domain-containing protein n=1 Tax=Zygotorulaspora mrakii TaxID=42260 RepID=A0A7H9AWU5_ZYGMR|nr:uncharacterized protein HG535_0A08360 [Zygotorulaspora mrakii]QLG70890.1 hypothetical protein HG535_0A08360 [Zygotorulaspora mrakii]
MFQVPGSTADSSNGRKSCIRSRYSDRAPNDAEEDYADTMNSETPGYISIKDFAYSQSNPLHYGYFDDSNHTSDNDGIDGSTEGTRGNEGAHEHDKRQSIILPDDYVINQLAVALYDFEPENDNELELKEGDIVFISYRHGQGWLVAENHERTKTGLVPEEFVTYLSDEDELASKYHVDPDYGEKARPFYLTQFITNGMNAQPTADPESTSKKEGDDADVQAENDDWEDIEQLNDEISSKLNISRNEKV